MEVDVLFPQGFHQRWLEIAESLKPLLLHGKTAYLLREGLLLLRECQKRLLSLIKRDFELKRVDLLFLFLDLFKFRKDLLKLCFLRLF